MTVLRCTYKVVQDISIDLGTKLCKRCVVKMLQSFFIRTVCIVNNNSIFMHLFMVPTTTSFDFRYFFIAVRYTQKCINNFQFTRYPKLNKHFIRNTPIKVLWYRLRLLQFKPMEESLIQPNCNYWTIKTHRSLPCRKSNLTFHSSKWHRNYNSLLRFVIDVSRQSLRSLPTYRPVSELYGMPMNQCPFKIYRFLNPNISPLRRCSRFPRNDAFCMRDDMSVTLIYSTSRLIN